jgi:hypothetical protein
MLADGKDEIRGLVYSLNVWEGQMTTRPTIALILRAFIYVALQFLAYKFYGLNALVAAWAVIVIITLIDVETTLAKVSQVVVQTAWFIYILAVIHMNLIA